MIEISIAFAFSVFFAGTLMFLAPCTLPLVPAYLAFIGGAKAGVAENSAKFRIIKNALAFVFGFSVIFIVLGVLFGLFGSMLGSYRILFSQIGGVFLMIFGFMVLGVFSTPLAATTKRFNVTHLVTPGTPLSAAVMGAAFALGWSPCIGPILASVLLLAGTSGTVLVGAAMLAIFSFGLAIPFVLVAIFYQRASALIARSEAVSLWAERVAGGLLLGIGILMLIDQFGLINAYLYNIFDFLHYEKLLEYL